ncbi:hypothetical protein CAPTEDRAFT_133781 [Capitella teleta]|uniref:G-protein coupled receptors family 1 profile domain-containing protein n=1 Tax=Capitella teleta TaxID=283909 RepID=R7UZ71_CAPTE|nr:hypothetical protein CAPTEDRAFT_133781 [Capitella teleta]|eukprot:ELU11873.1 hypothetical protein CAPTEDRAFT_133781 [Capitella teleta]
MFGAATTVYSICKRVYASSFSVLIPVACIHTATLLCSHFHILAVSLDRYIAIFFPLRYKGIMTSNVMTFSIVVVWMVATLFWLFVGLFGDIQHYETNRALAMFVLFLFYAILVLVLILYGRIAVIAYRQNRKINDKATTSPNGISRATRTLASIIGCYYIFWLPYFAFCGCLTFNIGIENKEGIRAMIDGSLLFAYLNSIANVFVYAFGTKAYKEWICAKCNSK